jgi:hypothetical protein
LRFLHDGGNGIIDNTAGSLVFRRSGSFTESMRLDTSGNLLVSTSSDFASGTVDGIIAQGTSKPAAAFSNTASGQLVKFYQGSSLVGSIGTDGSDIYIGSDDCNLFFFTNAVLPANSVGGGRDNAISLGASTTRFKDLHLSGQLVSNGSNNTVRASFQVSGTQYGYINVATTGTLYSTSSDYRIKENVVALTNATERLKQLNPLRFSFIPDQENTIVDGFFAHEVADVVPEAISGTKDAVDDDGNAVYQGIDQSKLVPLLVATIQELEARITQLENN